MLLDFVNFVESSVSPLVKLVESRLVPHRPSSCPPSPRQSFVPHFVKPGGVKSFNEVDTTAFDGDLNKIEDLIPDNNNNTQQLVMINI
jgi:hypothetical protein